MANLDQTEATTLLGTILKNVTYTSPGTVWLALDTANPTATAFGTEVSGGSYARQALSFAAASAGSISTNTAATYTSMPACTVVGAELFNAATGTARRIMWAASPSSGFTAKTVNLGDTFTVPSGSLQASLT